eukprot:702449-Alexandrium_andersonii.AAC.1
MDSATAGASAPHLAGSEASGGAFHPRANVHSGSGPFGSAENCIINCLRALSATGLNGAELSELSAFGAFKL